MELVEEESSDIDAEEPLSACAIYGNSVCSTDYEQDQAVDVELSPTDPNTGLIQLLGHFLYQLACFLAI